MKSANLDAVSHASVKLLHHLDVPTTNRKLALSAKLTCQNCFADLLGLKTKQNSSTIYLQIFWARFSLLRCTMPIFNLRETGKCILIWTLCVFFELEKKSFSISKSDRMYTVVREFIHLKFQHHTLLCDIPATMFVQ